MKFKTELSVTVATFQVCGGHELLERVSTVLDVAGREHSPLWKAYWTVLGWSMGRITSITNPHILGTMLQTRSPDRNEIYQLMIYNVLLKAQKFPEGPECQLICIV